MRTNAEPAATDFDERITEEGDVMKYVEVNTYVDQETGEIVPEDQMKHYSIIKKKKTHVTITDQTIWTRRTFTVRRDQQLKLFY